MTTTTPARDSSGLKGVDAVRMSAHTLGSRIRLARKRQKWTQTDLAKKCRCERWVISKLENDLVDSHMFLFIEIAKALAVSLDWLAFGKEAE